MRVNCLLSSTLLLCSMVSIPGALAAAAPAVGEPAPKVSVKKHLKDELVDLSKVERPTVIVFGSHT